MNDRVKFTTVSSPEEVRQILDLQKKNLATSLSAETIASQGFVTVQHDPAVLQRMNAAAPAVIAKDGDQMVGYALVMPRAFAPEVPILLPMWAAVDLDLIWMGVLVVVLLEVGLITPPVGLNAFVIKSVVGDQVPLTTIFRGLLWFVLMDLVVIAILVAFPEISTFLPAFVDN